MSACSFFCFVSLIAPSECCYLVTISAKCHGAPAAPAGSRVIVKKNLTLRIGALFEVLAGAFGNELGAGACDCRQQPFQALLASHESETPRFAIPLQLVVAFGNPHNSVDRFGPLRLQPLTAQPSPQDLT
ncbi:MAG TPA: hypothetical protein VFN20_04305 [Candidatus Acidoferrum sp.]|nr:hypothetical protein [Candidatus Acidoferrum sp.]